MAGIRGASFHKPSGKYQALITIDGKRKHLGYYNTEEDAGAAYKAAKAKVTAPKPKAAAPTVKQPKDTHIDPKSTGFKFDNAGFIFKFTKDDITVVSNDGKEKISATKAANCFMKHYHLLAVKESSKDEKIWIYDEYQGIYVPHGTRLICYMLEELGGDLCSPKLENNVINIIRNHVSFSIEQFDPDAHMLCVRNGVIDLRSGKFMDHSYKYMMSAILNVEYRPGVKCLIFDKFLEDVLEHELDKDTIYDFMAATLIKKPFDVFISLTGTGSNGKGRLIHFIRWFIGVENVTTTRITNLGKRFQSTWLFKKWLILNGELEGDFPIGSVKDVTSGNPMQGEIKNGGVFEFIPFVKAMFDTNNPPIIHDDSDGRKRRHINLNFIKKFVDNPTRLNDRKIDRDILDKLETEEQKSGVLNELIPRAIELLNGRGIYRRKSEQETADEYDMQTHSDSSFIDGWCEFDQDFDKFTYSSELYEAYKRFCATINVPPKSQKALGAYLNKLGYRATHEGEKRLMAYRGIQLKPLIRIGADGEKAIA